MFVCVQQLVHGDVRELKEEEERALRGRGGCRLVLYLFCQDGTVCLLDWDKLIDYEMDSVPSVERALKVEHDLFCLKRKLISLLNINPWSCAVSPLPAQINISEKE